jgi:type IV pilus assembly protein PilE
MNWFDTFHRAKFASLKQGFSLIELLIVLAIFGIIISIALPNYMDYLRESRRTQALTTLTALQLAEQRYRTKHDHYADLNQSNSDFVNNYWSKTETKNGYYKLSVSNITATGYTITAKAQGDQINDKANGVSCATLILQVKNSKIKKTPPACWQ